MRYLVIRMSKFRTADVTKAINTNLFVKYSLMGVSRGLNIWNFIDIFMEGYQFFLYEDLNLGATNVDFYF